MTMIHNSRGSEHVINTFYIIIIIKSILKAINIFILPRYVYSFPTAHTIICFNGYYQANKQFRPDANGYSAPHFVSSTLLSSYILSQFKQKAFHCVSSSVSTQFANFGGPNGENPGKYYSSGFNSGPSPWVPGSWGPYGGGECF